MTNEEALAQGMPKIGCVNHDCDKCKEQSVSGGEPDDLTIAYMSGLHRGKDLAPQRKPMKYEQIKRMLELLVVPPQHVEMVVRAIEVYHGIKENT